MQVRVDKKQHQNYFFQTLRHLILADILTRGVREIHAYTKRKPVAIEIRTQTKKKYGSA